MANLMLMLIVGASTGLAASSYEEARTSRQLYAQEHFGLYFYGPGDTPIEAVPGQDNPFFSPDKPTFVYIHGWSFNELTRDKVRTFNVHRDFPEAPDLNLIELWRAKGWNFAMLDWTQFADTEFDAPIRLPTEPYAAAERRIWAPDESGHLIYYLSDGSAHTYQETGVAELLAKRYFEFMNPVAKPGLEVRLQGQSLGAQLAIVFTAKLVHFGSSQNPLNPAIVPSRVALTDLIASRGLHRWLPPTSDSGEAIGRHLDSAVRELKQAPYNMSFEAYHCSPLSWSGSAADPDPALLRQMVLTNLRPNVAFYDVFAQHQFCMWSYMASLRLPPPSIVEPPMALTERVDTITCADLQYGGDTGLMLGGASASTPTPLLQQMMASGLVFRQTPNSVGVAGEQPFTMGCIARSLPPAPSIEALRPYDPRAS